MGARFCLTGVGYRSELHVVVVVVDTIVFGLTRLCCVLRCERKLHMLFG